MAIKLPDGRTSVGTFDGPYGKKFIVLSDMSFMEQSAYEAWASQGAQGELPTQYKKDQIEEWVKKYDDLYGSGPLVTAVDVNNKEVKVPKSFVDKMRAENPTASEFQILRYAADYAAKKQAEQARGGVNSQISIPPSKVAPDSVVSAPEGGYQEMYQDPETGYKYYIKNGTYYPADVRTRDAKDINPNDMPGRRAKIEQDTETKRQEALKIEQAQMQANEVKANIQGLYDQMAAIASGKETSDAEKLFQKEYQAAKNVTSGVLNQAKGMTAGEKQRTTQATVQEMNQQQAQDQTILKAQQKQKAQDMMVALSEMLQAGDISQDDLKAQQERAQRILQGNWSTENAARGYDRAVQRGQVASRENALRATQAGYKSANTSAVVGNILGAVGTAAELGSN